MTSSSSLYGTVNTQSTNSGNSTSLYGEAGTPIPDTAGNLVVRGDLVVLSGNILTTAATGNIFPANATTINLGLAATAVNIGANTGTTTINNNLVADSGDFGNITIGVTDAQTITTTSGDLNLTAFGNNNVNIDSGTNAPTVITRNTVNTNTSTRSLALAVQSSGTPAVGFGNSIDFQVETAVGNTEQAGFIAVVSTDLTAGSEDFTMAFGLMQNGSAYTTKMFLDSTGSLALDNDLTIGGNNINLAQTTTIGYDENNIRANRPQVQSTSGNSSGFRVLAPNATTSASSNLTVFATNDYDNGEFLSIQATGSTSAPFSIRTGLFTAGVLSASGEEINFVDGVTTYASVNPAGPTNGTDLTTKTYVDALVAASGVTSITGTADQVIASSPTGAVTLSLPQSIATTSNVTFADVIVGDDLTVQGNNVNLAQTTTIGYDENNVRANRPQVQSTSGNSSGFRVLAPNATTSASSNLTVFGSNDYDNGEFLSLEATGSTSIPFTIRTGKYTAGVLGASNEEINIADGVTTYASINPAGPTNPADLTTKAYVDALPAGGVTSITGTTDQVIASSSTGAITLSLPQSIATTSNPTFAGATLDAVTVGIDSAQTISTSSGNLVLQTAAGVNAGTITMTAGTNGAINITPNGTGTVVIPTADVTTLDVTNIRALDGTAAASIANTTGAVSITTQLTVDNLNINGNTLISTDTNGNIALAPNGTGNVTNTFSNGGNITNNRNYVFGAIRNATTQTTNGDIWELNTSAAQSASNPYFRGVSIDNSADTNRGPATLLRSYAGPTGGGSASRGRVVFEKARGTAASPSAVQNNDLLGSVDATGYTSTGWLNDTIPAVGGFFGFTATENWVSNTNLGTGFGLSLLPTATTVTSGASLIPVLALSPQSFTTRSDTYDFQQGKTGTTSLLALTSTLATFVGDVRINGNDIQGSGGSSAITLTSANTATTVRGDTINLQTAASAGIASGAISYGRQYIEAFSSVNQTNPVANAENLMAFENTGISNGVSIVTNGTTLTRITFANAGIYNLQFSAQLSQTSGGGDNAFIWLKKNGANVANTAGDTRVAGNGDRIMAAWNYVFSAAAGDYYELAWSATDTSVILEAVAASAPVPAVPSVILTVVPVGA